jgi:hypothetical protein
MTVTTANPSRVERAQEVVRVTRQSVVSARCREIRNLRLPVPNSTSLKETSLAGGNGKDMGEGHRAVGYQRPPEHCQFKRGQSGNPRGRPRGKGDLAATFEKILNEPLQLKFKGRWIAVTGREALAIVLAERSATGDVRIIRLLQRYKYFDKTDPPRVIWLPESAKYL